MDNMLGSERIGLKQTCRKCKGQKFVQDNNGSQLVCEQCRGQGEHFKEITLNELVGYIEKESMKKLRRQGPLPQ